MITDTDRARICEWIGKWLYTGTALSPVGYWYNGSRRTEAEFAVAVHAHLCSFGYVYTNSSSGLTEVSVCKNIADIGKQGQAPTLSEAILLAALAVIDSEVKS